MAGNEGKRPVAPHVAAAVAGAAQCKTVAGRPAPAAHVAAAIGSGRNSAVQAKPAAPPLRPAPAAHVAAAIGRHHAVPLQAKPAPAYLQRPAAPPPRVPPRAAAPARPPEAIQRMEAYSDHPTNPTWLKVVEHEKIGQNLDLDFGEVNQYFLEGDSDDDEVIETTENFYRAHREITKKVEVDRKLKPPPKRGHLKKVNLSDNESQWKRVNTEYIGEVGGFHTMIEKGYKMGLSTGVLGGKGLDQIWYKGSITGNNITEMVVVECKGPGASLSQAQQGKTAAKLSTEWVRKNAKTLKKSKVQRRRRIGRFIRENTGTGKVRGLIVRYDLNRVKKVGKMHNL